MAWVYSVWWILFVVGCLCKVVCMVQRKRRAELVASLSAYKDPHALRRLSFSVEFPFLSSYGLDFAYCYPEAIPSISKLLRQTGQFENRMVKRYDDTDILMKEFINHHVDSDRGSLAIQRVNFLHSNYNISNEDFVYTLAALTIMPERWISKYGFRKLTEGEKTANFVVWHNIGSRMGMQSIPPTLDELKKYMDDYEYKHMVYSKDNHVVANSTLDMLLSRLPKFSRPFARRAVYTLLEDRVREALGYPKQPLWLQYLVAGLLKFVMGTCVSFFRSPREISQAVDRLYVDTNDKAEVLNPEKVYDLAYNLYSPVTYPHGYKIPCLGALKPGMVRPAASGDLMCPLHTSYFSSWPPKLRKK